MSHLSSPIPLLALHSCNIYLTSITRAAVIYSTNKGSLNYSIVILQHRHIQVEVSFFELNLNKSQTLNQPSNKGVHKLLITSIWIRKGMWKQHLLGMVLWILLFVFFSSMVLLLCFSILLDIIIYVIFFISKFCCIPNSHASIMRASVELPLSNLLKQNWPKLVNLRRNPPDVGVTSGQKPSTKIIYIVLQTSVGLF